MDTIKILRYNSVMQYGCNWCSLNDSGLYVVDIVCGHWSGILDAWLTPTHIRHITELTVPLSLIIVILIDGIAVLLINDGLGIGF